MRQPAQRTVQVLMVIGFLFVAAVPVRAADPEIDRLLERPVGKDWVTNGGTLCCTDQ